MLEPLLKRVRACQQCVELPLGPNPILQAHTDARILVAGQAPGRITHNKNRPFDDPSGERLRYWLGVDRESFYNPAKLAIIPMAFCYPGTGKSGDLPPPAHCAELWRENLLQQLPNIELTILIGQYAMDWHLPNRPQTLTDTVKSWQQYWPEIIPIPHPSPRNNRWLKNNPWFEEELLPPLRERVSQLLG